MNKRKIILDSDPGHDDAIAILVAGIDPRIELLGISVINGNQTLEKTANNTRNICEYLGIDIPIAKGMEKPLFKEPVICPEIHGESGLDGFEFPKYDKPFDKRDGPQLIIDTVMNNDDVTIVPTGPLTNIATALQREPKIKSHIKEIVLMGGSTTEGNITKYAEFNIFVDPEAAWVVFNSGLPIKMIGLNVTRQIPAKEEIIQRMEKINNKASDLFAKLMRVFNKNQHDFFGLEAGPLHDPATVISIIDPSAFTFKPMNVEIDLSMKEKYGQTRCSNFMPYNAEVAISVDLDKYWNIIEQNIRRYGDE